MQSASAEAQNTIKPGQRLRIAVAGAGMIGRRHIELLRQSPQTQLCAVIDPAPEAAHLAISESVPHHTSIEQFLSACDPERRPDGIILATPNTTHVAGAMTCLQYGIPALIEKPVADALAEAEKLVEAQAVSSTPLLVGHHRRHSPILASVRNAIVEGKLGQEVTVTGTALFYKPDDYFTAGPWRTVSGGGPLLINLIHEIDSLRYLLGEITAVQAMSSSAVRRFEVEDTAVITLRFASGALGSFALSDTAASPRSWEQASGENQAYDSHPAEDCYFIAGTRGSLAVPTMRLWTYEGERSWREPLTLSELPSDRADPLALQLNHFCDVINGREQPLVSVLDAAQSLRVTLAIIEAARSGNTIYTESLK